MQPVSRSLLIAVSFAALSCGRNEAHSAADTAQTSNVVTARGAAREPADTEIVRNLGVPTDADDTASTHYNKHQTPRRLSNPACWRQGPAMCLRDPATTIYSV